MNKLEYETIKAMIAPVFRRYGVRRAMLFGSYAKQTATEKSDVDLLVDSGLKGMKFVGLIEDIKTALKGKDVDVLDETHLNSDSPLVDEIAQTGVLIYEG